MWALYPPFSKYKGKSEALGAGDRNKVTHQTEGTVDLGTRPEHSMVIVNFVCCDRGIVFT